MAELPFDPKKLPSRRLDVPDLKDAVEGWRAWKVDTELPRFGVAPKLFSATQDYYWIPRRAAEAECDRGCAEKTASDGSTEESDVPGEFCSCGFYSAKSFEHMMSMSYYHYDGDDGYFTVIGQIANWGKVVEGSLGWRSQYSYPKRLWVPFEANQLAKPISDAYGVPCTLRNFLTPADADL